MPATLKVRRKAHLTASTECLISAAPTGLSRVMRLLGALLGSGAAYLALAAGHRSDISVLSQVPVLDLAITVVGVPAAALADWILAGRKQSSIARQALD